MPAPRRPQSPCPAWRTSAVTRGPACPPTAVAQCLPCSPWTGYPTSISLPTSPRGRSCPAWAAWPTTRRPKLQTATECSSTKALTSPSSGSVDLRQASNPLPAASSRPSSSIPTVCLEPCRHTSTTLCTAWGWCQSGVRTANQGGREAPEPWGNPREQEKEKEKNPPVDNKAFFARLPEVNVHC